ncbi:hypothetical protein D3C77_525420 [compost metagenome]
MTIASTTQARENSASAVEPAMRLPSQAHRALARVSERNISRPDRLCSCCDRDGCAGAQPWSQGNQPVPRLPRACSSTSAVLSNASFELCQRRIRPQANSANNAARGKLLTSGDQLWVGEPTAPSWLMACCRWS